jgi:hypothetical protein
MRKTSVPTEHLWLTQINASSAAAAYVTCSPQRIIHMRTALVNLILVALMVASTTFAEAACGDKGGPGYRGQDGRCQSWRDLGRNCGSPPTKGCTGENVAAGAGAGASHGQVIEDLKKNQHGNR